MKARVRAWRDHLRAVGPPDVGPLSAEGRALAWQVALDALSDEALDAAWSLPADPYPDATMVVARTVLTAPLEWCAVWWGHGTRVRLKVPRAAPAFGAWLEATTASFDLPLEVVTDPADAVGSLVVAMGRDATVTALRERLPAGRPFLAFGHRFSVAAAEDEVALRGVVDDLVLHDTRGCLSPVAVFTDVPDALEVVAEAMAEAQTRVPRGALSAHEGAALRERRALARVLGRTRSGDGWDALWLPADRFVPVVSPRQAVIHPGGVAAMEAAVAPWSAHLSTVGHGGATALAARHVPCGTMQRPALRRLHDGIDWVAAAVRARVG